MKLKILRGDNMLYLIGGGMVLTATVMMAYHAYKLAELFEQAAVETLMNPFEPDFYVRQRERERLDDLVELF